jgi:hypothetical protein
METNGDNPNCQIRVKPDTRRKLDLIASHGRRTLTETMDLLCDFYMDANGISWPETPANPNA